MANYYDTLLVCTTDSKLLHKIDASSLINESNSEFISCNDGIYHFTTIDGTMHENILALSEKHPDEIFIAQFWNVDFYDSELQTYKYISGKSRCTKIEPNYGYCISHIEKIMGKKPLRRFMKVVLKQIKKIDSTNDIPTIKTNRLERKHNIRSSVTINVEDDDFRIEATKIGSSFIEVCGYIKEEPTPKWQLIEKDMNGTSRVTYQIRKSNNESTKRKYEDVPF